MKETETMSETANDSENKISELTHQLEEKNTALENMKSEVVELGNKLKQGEEEVGYKLQ
jgi:cell division protein FtsL